MRWTLERLHLRQNLRHLVSAIAILLVTTSLWAHPATGTPAPPLSSITLLQTPPGTRTDWASLRGKVVILEFWATWCSPCIASLPHINQLVESLDPAKFQFISIDDENPKDIQNFLTKKKMSGWVGTDISGNVFRQYGVQSRPTTVIVDRDGKVVAITEIDTVTAADLNAVADGKNATFKPVMEIVEKSAPSNPAAADSIFTVSVSMAPPEAKMAFVKHPPTGIDMLGHDADSLLTNVFDTFQDQYVLKDVLPNGRFDLRVNAVDVPDAVRDDVVRQAVLAVLHVQIQPKTIHKPAYILRATEVGNRLLSPSASTHAVKRGSWHGKFLLMNGTMDDLAYVLSTGLENPVVNETGIDGTYDVRFEVAEGGFNSLNTILKRTYGLELVPGGQEMSITVLEVSAQEANRSPHP